MKTFSNPDNAAEIIERLRRLRPDSARRWGKMTPHQTVCHLSDAFRHSLGERACENRETFLYRTIGKWIALRTPIPWPRNVQTTPSADQHAGGTAPVEFDTDRQELEHLIRRFVGKDPKLGKHPHPLFGLMADRDWMVWGWRHCDHHLRQFGL